jgi:phosphopantothenoylcysteine synthetase/decarboxylase
MMNILLGVTASVAATLTPKLCRELMKVGNVKVVATEKSRYFFDYFEVENILHGSPVDTESYSSDAKIYFDQQEWESNRYHKNQDIPHITLGNWADIFVIAPLTANTLAKMSTGIADNLLTSTYLAWDRMKPIIIAPAMNTRMWNHPATQTNLILLKTIHEAIDIIDPVVKLLACGEEGVGAMAEIKTIISTVLETKEKHGL